MRMTRRSTYCLALLVGLTFCLIGAGRPGREKKNDQSPVSLESLLTEMIDLSRLTRLPTPAYRTRQFSSFNRASVSHADPEGWFANLDRGYYLRTEERAGRKEFVMMDAEGPGAIVRLWSADPKGVLRIYVDHSTQPVLEDDLKQLLGGSGPWFPEPLAGQRGRGWNLYFPMPFAVHCKVTCDADQMFYHINYRKYEPGTQVSTFNSGDLARLAPVIASAARTLAGRDSPVSGKTVQKDLLLRKASQSKVLAQLVGPLVITGLYIDVRSDGLSAALRSTVLSMVVDGEQTVEVPLGDFFGTAPGANPYRSLAMGVEPKPYSARLWSKWWMPFRRSAKLSLRAFGEQAVSVRARIVTAPYRWNEDSLLFHAGWRIQRAIPSWPFTDWTHLLCEGRGRFVGGALHVVNPVRGWWGEGDEKIYVDGEAFPSHFGTGSEDYYGYAWCDTHLFDHAYHNQTRCDGPGNYGHTSVNRFHVLDDIPFDSSFRFDMENWHHNALVKTDRAAVSYWYARPGGRSFFRPLTAADLEVPVVPEYRIPVVAGAIEAESMTVVRAEGPAGPVDVGERFSSGREMRWTPERLGSQLVLRFDWTGDTARPVSVRLTLGPAAPRVRVRVNDGLWSPNIDLYHHRVTPDREILLGTPPLKRGDNQVVIEVTGTHPSARSSYRVGLDYIRIE